MKLTKHLQVIEQDIRNKLLLMYDFITGLHDIMDFDTFIEKDISIHVTDMRQPELCTLSVKILGSGIKDPLHVDWYDLRYDDFSSDHTKEEFFSEISSFAERLMQKKYLGSSTDGIPNKFHKIQINNENGILFSIKLLALEDIYKSMSDESLDMIDIGDNDTVAVSAEITNKNEVHLFFTAKEVTYNGED